MTSMIRKLSEAIGPSGYEGEVQTIICDEITPLVDEISTESPGNLIAIKKGKNKNAKKLMVYSNMDETGLIATHVDRNGFVRFAPVGKIEPEMIAGCRVKFLNGTHGIVGIDNNPVASQRLSLERMFVDCGAENNEVCPVQVGDTAVFYSGFIDFGKRIAGKALDNRVGVYVMIETMKRIITSSAYELVFVFCAQGQVGSRGAPTAAFAVDPEIAISIGVIAGKSTNGGLKGGYELGKGPAIKIRDASSISEPSLVSWIADTAEEMGIPYQREVGARGRGEIDTVQLVRAGVRTCGLSIPGRYLHSGNELVDLNDIENCIRLLCALLEKTIEV